MNQSKETERASASVGRQITNSDALQAARLDLAARMDSNSLLRDLVSHAIELTGADGGRLHLYHSERGLLELGVAVGIPSSSTAQVFPGGATTVERVIESRRALLTTKGPRETEDDTFAAVAAVPIQRDGQIIAVLEVLARSPDAFSAEDMDLLTSLSDSAALAFRNARLYEETALRAEHLAIVNRIAEAVSKTLDLEGLTRVVYREIKAVFELDAFFLALYDDATKELNYRFQIDGGVTVKPERRPLGSGLTASVIKDKAPVVIRNFATERDHLPTAELWGSMKTPSSWLGVPMQVGDRTVGVICVQSYRPNAYGDIEQQLLTTIAEQVGVGIENTRLYEETSRRLAQTQVLRELMLAAASSLDFDQVLDRTLEALHTKLGIERVGFIMPEHGKTSLRIHPSQVGFPAELADTAFDLESTVSGHVFRTGEPIVVTDHRELSDGYESRPGTHSQLAVPVGVYGEVAGVLNLESSHADNFNEGDLDFYLTIASQLSVALENARLFEAERRQREQTKALEEAAAVVSGTLNLEQVLDRILEQVEKVVDGDAFNVILIESDKRGHVARRRGYESEEWGVEHVSIPNYPLLQKMIQTGEPIAVPDTAAHPLWVEEEGQESWRSYVGAPIQVGGVVVGFLNVNSIWAGTFSDQDAQRLQAFANHAATALENAQLYQELHRHADALEERVEERTSQLRAQYAQLETILDSITDGIILASSDGELILANPVARNWLRHALSPEEAEELREAVKALAARAEMRPEIVLELTGLDLQLMAAPVQKPTTEDARAVVAIHDVSHLKTLNRMKSRFVSNVSHELRTPIATIKLLAHLMEKQPDRIDEYLKPLMREAEHQAKLVRDILEMSRVDAGRMDIHPQPLNLNELIEIAGEKYVNQAQDKGLSIRYQLGRANPIALADSKWMMQVVNNLLSNAVRYTPEGGTITISTDTKTAEGRVWALLTVTDTGIGIPEEELPHIFDRFFRGEEPRQMQISGTGLGLAILREIVELHGGRVIVESQVGEGSSFTVAIPHKPD